MGHGSFAAHKKFGEVTLSVSVFNVPDIASRRNRRHVTVDEVDTVVAERTPEAVASRAVAFFQSGCSRAGAGYAASNV